MLQIVLKVELAFVIGFDELFAASAYPQYIETLIAVAIGVDIVFAAFGKDYDVVLACLDDGACQSIDLIGEARRISV